MTLSDAEVRHLTIELLTAATARDLQKTIGASNLANGCSYCLACAFAGISRDTPATDRAWSGRTIGTALHRHLEERFNEAISAHRVHIQAVETEKQRAFYLDGADMRQIIAGELASIGECYPNAKTEFRITLGSIENYGTVGSTVDVVLPDERHGVDYKGSTRKKSALMQDFLSIQRGGEAIYGRTHAEIKLSEKEYAKALEAQAYKLTGYYSQCQSYMDGLNRAGIPTERFSLVFINRDGTGWFDNPTQPDYELEKRTHDVWVLSFDHDPAYAKAVWDRGVNIWNQLFAGASVEDFESHPQCFPCSLDRKPEVAAETLVVAA
jgi:hypothetical protein